MTVEVSEHLEQLLAQTAPKKEPSHPAETQKQRLSDALVDDIRADGEQAAQQYIKNCEAAAKRCEANAAALRARGKQVAANIRNDYGYIAIAAAQEADTKAVIEG